MTNKFENIGVKAIEEIISWVKKAGDILEEQAPLLVHEVLEYEILTSWIWITIAVIILLIAILLLWLVIKDNDEGIGTTITIVLIVPSLCTIGMQINDIIMATVAPRVYMIEYLKDLI